MPLIKWKLDADSSGFKRATAEIGNEINKVTGDLASRMGLAGQAMSALGPAGIAAAAAIGGVGAAMAVLSKVTADAVSHAANYADHLDALAIKTGLTTDALQELEVAAKLGNSSLEAVAQGVNKMQKELVTGSDAFKKLGLNVADLKKMSPESQFQAVSKAIDTLGSDADKAAARMAVFGKSGNDLAGTMEAMSSGAAKLGGTLSGDALKAAAELRDKTDLLGIAWDRVKKQWGAAIAQSPELRQAIDDLTGFVVGLAEAIKDNSKVIVTWVNTFVTGARLMLSSIRPLGEFLSDMASGRYILAFTNLMANIKQLAATAMLGAPVFGGGGGGGRRGGGGPDFSDPGKVMHLVQKNLGGLRLWMPWDPMFGAVGPGNVMNMGPQGNLGYLGQHVPGMKGMKDWFEPLPEVTKATMDWSQQLDNVANQLRLFGGPGNLLASFAGGIAAIGANIQAFKAVKGGGIGGFLGKASGVLGIAGAAFDIGKSIFGKLFGGGPSKEEIRKQQNQQLLDQSLPKLEGWLKRLNEIQLDKLNAGVGGLAALFKNAADSADLTQARMDRLGLLGGAMFEQLKRQGLSTVEAFKAMGPALDQAIAAAEKSGLQVTGTLGMLAEFRQKVSDNETLASAAEGLSSVFDALRSTGILTQETFAAFRDEMLSVFDELTAKGFTSNEALALIAPTLYQIKKAAEEGRIQIDAETQALIDQAEKAGLFDNLKDPMAEMVEIQKLMLETTAALVKAFGADLPASVQKYIDKLNQVPNLPGPPGKGTGGNDNGNVNNGQDEDGYKHYQHGGYVHKTGLAYLHAGETVVPADGVVGGIGEIGGHIDDEGNYVPPGGGGGGGVVGGPAGGPGAVERIAESVAQKIGARRPVNVQVAVPIDASTVPAAHRQQFIEDLGREVGRQFLPGKPNYRFIQQAVRTANAEG